MEEFYRIRRLPPYVFEQVNRAKAAARNAGADIIDLGMGNPDMATPPHVIEKLKETLGKPRTDRYSASRGITGLRKAQAAYYARRFGVKLNPETQVVATLGSIGADAAILRGGGARDHPFDPETARHRGLLSLQSDRLCREPGFLPGSGRLREEA